MGDVERSLKEIDDSVVDSEYEGTTHNVKGNMCNSENKTEGGAGL